MPAKDGGLNLLNSAAVGAATGAATANESTIYSGENVAVTSDTLATEELKRRIDW